MPKESRWIIANLQQYRGSKIVHKFYHPHYTHCVKLTDFRFASLEQLRSLDASGLCTAVRSLQLHRLTRRRHGSLKRSQVASMDIEGPGVELSRCMVLPKTGLLTSKRRWVFARFTSENGPERRLKKTAAVSRPVLLFRTGDHGFEGRFFKLSELAREYKTEECAVYQSPSLTGRWSLANRRITLLYWLPNC